MSFEVSVLLLWRVLEKLLSVFTNKDLPFFFIQSVESILAQSSATLLTSQKVRQAESKSMHDLDLRRNQEPGMYFAELCHGLEKDAIKSL